MCNNTEEPVYLRLSYSTTLRIANWNVDVSNHQCITLTKSKYAKFRSTYEFPHVAVAAKGNEHITVPVEVEEINRICCRVKTQDIYSMIKSLRRQEITTEICKGDIDRSHIDFIKKQLRSFANTPELSSRQIGYIELIMERSGDLLPCFARILHRIFSSVFTSRRTKANGSRYLRMLELMNVEDISEADIPLVNTCVTMDLRMSDKLADKFIEKYPDALPVPVIYYYFKHIDRVTKCRDINELDLQGVNIWVHALNDGNREKIKKLIELGANPHLPMLGELSVLDVANEPGLEEYKPVVDFIKSMVP